MSEGKGLHYFCFVDKGRPMGDAVMVDASVLYLRDWQRKCEHGSPDVIQDGDRHRNVIVDVVHKPDCRQSRTGCVHRLLRYAGGTRGLKEPTSDPAGAANG
ncbi:hypothetical protein J6590_018907 [Homalodisca vitripennis]|nr:hypothetical protein J6590_018907 [Homalodisca vitripennis]